LKILVVDDHFAIREGVRALFSATPGAVVVAASTAHDALKAFRSDRPDVVVTDINLPDASGLELLVKVLIEDQTARIVIFTADATPELATRTLAAGALGYVSKAAPVHELMDAVHAVAHGHLYIEADIKSELYAPRLKDA
jgi:two-component system, NarL family, invasion response regulator UvrY